MQKNIMWLLSASALISLSPSAWSDMIYKCKNQQGDLFYQKSPCKENVQTVSSWTAVAKVQAQAHEPEKKVKDDFIIKQNRSGYYFLEGAINDKSLTFVIDTGASFVSLPRSFAQGAGLYCKDKIDMQTANGLINGCKTTIKKLNIGPFFINDVTAVIVPKLNQPLLGMNVLQQFNMVQEKGELRLSERE
jgi:clan AA aspartic protease (TIGR02281 family)